MNKKTNYETLQMLNMNRTIIIIIIIILAGIGLSYVNEQVSRNRCYELTPQDFYKNKSCTKYIKEYEND